MQLTTDPRVTSYPDESVTTWTDAGLWRRHPIAVEVRRTATRFPQRLSIVTADARLTYAELDARADLAAHRLLDAGLRPGDPVLLQVTNRWEVVVLWYGLLKAGLVPVATLAAHRAHEIGAISRAVGAVAHVVEAGLGSFDLVGFAEEQRQDHPSLRLVVTIGAPARSAAAATLRFEDLVVDGDVPAARAAVDRVQADLGAADVAVLQLSGGTTGVPKVIPRLHAEYWYNARAYAETLGWDETTRTAHLIPIVHNAGVVCALHATHAVGGCLVLSSPYLDAAMPLMVREEVTDVLLGHGHFGAVARDDFPDLARTLRTVILSGTKVPDALFERIEELDVWSGQLFGMGEGFFAITQRDAPREARLTTVGTPMSPYDEFRVLEPGSEREVADGEVGELVCRGPYTLRGYFDAPEHNARAFTSDGFYRTGDLVTVRTIDGQRHISVEGREKAMINRGGEKISADEVEALLLRHPGIEAAAVVAMPDERLGEKSCAYLVAADDALTLHDVQAHMDSLGVAKFKWPERLEWVIALPRTPVGKLDKKHLAADIREKLASEAPHSSDV